MPIIFKIFLFLLLQQGGKIVRDQKEGINWQLIQAEQPSGDMKLVIEGESAALEQIISVCITEDLSCQVEREPVYDATGMERVRGILLFKNLKSAQRLRLMERTQPLRANTTMQWITM